MCNNASHIHLLVKKDFSDAEESLHTIVLSISNKQVHTYIFVYSKVDEYWQCIILSSDNQGGK